MDLKKLISIDFFLRELRHDYVTLLRQAGCTLHHTTDSNLKLYRFTRQIVVVHITLPAETQRYILTGNLTSPWNFGMRCVIAT